jgi:hypothetical protein
MEVCGQLRAPIVFISENEELHFSTHCIGGWVSPRAVVDLTLEKEYIMPLPGIEPVTSLSCYGSIPVTRIPPSEYDAISGLVYRYAMS